METLAKRHIMITVDESAVSCSAFERIRGAGTDQNSDTSAGFRVSHIGPGDRPVHFLWYQTTHLQRLRLFGHEVSLGR